MGLKKQRNWHEWLELFSVRLHVALKNAREFLQVVVKYYRQPLFCRLDLRLLLRYCFNNPFHVSRRFLTARGESEIYTYGETPLTTLATIAQRCNLTAHDTVYELGCGRGRTCFWLNQFVGCRVVGIDYVPTFIEQANHLVHLYQLNRITFRLADFTALNYRKATVIYLYGTCLPEETICALCSQLTILQIGAKVITVSYALREFDSTAPFEVIDTFEVSFTWGAATVYLQRKLITPSS